MIETKYNTDTGVLTITGMLENNAYQEQYLGMTFASIAGRRKEITFDLDHMGINEPSIYMWIELVEKYLLNTKLVYKPSQMTANLRLIDDHFHFDSVFQDYGAVSMVRQPMTRNRKIRWVATLSSIAIGLEFLATHPTFKVLIGEILIALLAVLGYRLWRFVATKFSCVDHSTFPMGIK